MNSKKLQLTSAFVLFLVIGVNISLFSFLSPPSFQSLFLRAEAGDDEYENEDEDERQSSSSTEESEPKTKKIKVLQSVVEYRPVTKVIIVTEEAYTLDTDGDQLVDALDPDPLIKQSEYFEDIDGDGVPNALDKHHDEDDFAYIETEADENNNGILDSYEQ